MDLIQTQEPNLLPADTAQPEYSRATSRFLGMLSNATNARLNSIAVPRTQSEWDASVATKYGEERTREVFANDELQGRNAVVEELARDAILSGAGAADVENIMRGVIPVTEDVPGKSSVLERNAAKFLVEQGFATPERANAVILDEFVEGKETASQREDFAATMLRLNTIRSKLADRFSSYSFSEKALDFLAMAFVPGHTTASMAKVFGRGAERLGTSIENFQNKFWGATSAEQMTILDQFEADLDSNTVVADNVLAALNQVEDLISFKPEQKLEYDITEGLDALAIASAPFGIIRAFRTISSAARLLGSKDVAVARTVELKNVFRTEQDIAEMGRWADDGGPVPEGDPVSRQFTVSRDFEANQTNDYARWADDGGRIIEEDELVDNLTPTFATPEKLVEKAVGPANDATEAVDISRAYNAVLPTLEKRLDEAGIKLPEEATPSELLMALKGVVTPDILDAAEQGLANKQAMAAILKQFGLDKQAQKIEQVNISALDTMMGKTVPMFDVDIDEVSGIRTVSAYLGTGTNRLKGYVSEASAKRGAERLGLQDGFYEIVGTLPPVKAGYTRFYHGAAESKFSGGARWLTPDPEYARNFRAEGTLKNVFYVDIANDNPLLRKAFDDTGTDQLAPFIPFEAPEEIASKLKPLPKSTIASNYEISNRSGEYFIKVTRNPGTTEFVRLIDDADLPKVLPVLGKYLQGAKTTQDYDAIAGASLSVKASSILARQVGESVKKIQKLGKDSRDTYNNLMLEIQQQEAWKSMDEVQSFYINNYQRLPTEKEKEAYIATRQLHSFDYVVRNATVQKELTSLGYQEVKIRDIPGFPTIAKEVATTSVDPRSTRIYDAVDGKFVSVSSREDLAKLLARSNDLILVKTLQEHKSFGQYVIAPRTDVNIKALRSHVLNWVDGPHRLYDGDTWIKQQKIGFDNGRETIFNPRTHFVLKGRSEATKVAEDYNAALEAYTTARMSNDRLEIAKASEVIARRTRYAGFDEFHKAVEDGDIELSPFEVLKDGELPKYRAAELEGSKQIDPDFTNLSDDLKNMIENGRMFYSTRGERLQHPYRGLAPLLHPNEIMTRAINNVINTAAYTNYKVRQVDRWVKSYGKYMVGYDPSRPAVETFMHGQWDNSSKAPFRLPANIQDRAEAQRMAIKRFLNSTGTIEQEASKYRDLIIDVIDNRVNQKWADRFANVTSNDPIAFARGIAFRMYLGFADISQLAVQLAVMPGVLAVNAKEGAKAASVLPIVRGALVNPKHDSFLGSLVAKAGIMEKQQFVDMVADLRRSGIDIIDANLGDLDNMNNKGWMTNRVGYYGGKIDKALMLPFHEAEKANRIVTFSMAWLEHYARTGRRLETPEDFAAVRVRSDALAGNMDRDGKAAWQTGVLSLPAQFAGHPARVTELLLGKTPGQFNGKDKLKFYTGLALAYGPLLGAGNPLYNWIQEKYREATGEYPNQEVMTGLTRGVVGMLMPETDISRLQPFAQDTLLSDLFKEDGGIGFEEFMGPSGQLGSTFIEATLGKKKLWALMSGQVGFDLVPLALADVANDVFKSIASYNRAERAITVWQTKKLLSRSGQVLQEDLDHFDAIMVGLGFPPIESREAFEASANHKDYRKKVFKDAALAVTYLRKAIDAEEGSETARLNYSYFHTIAKLHKYGDVSGEGSDIFRQEVDKLMRNQGAYNEQVFQRIYRDLNKMPPGIVRK